MFRYIVRRLLIAIPVVFLVILATFVLVQSMPGGPFDTVGQRAMPENMIRILERRYGLDRPLYEQFFRYVINILQGDFGPMFRQPALTVSDVLGQTFPVSIQLGAMATIIAFVLGIPIGIIAALNHNTIMDYVATFVAVVSISVPNLVLGPVLIYFLALKLQLFPIAFWGENPPFFLGFIPNFSKEFFSHAVLPVVSLGTGAAAGIARLTRAGLLEVLSSDYIRTARAKGLRERVVIVVHALKNSLIPVATILGPLLANLLTGTFIIETIFAINGMGRRFVSSIAEREYFLQTGLVLIYGILLVMGNLLVDVMYAWLDPRIRYD
jgi:ABC-type dipeptide/oligopeptide/nickel transport system permease component